MTGKRPHESDGRDGENKRIRSNNGSPVAAPPVANGESEMERKKRDAQERIAAMKARMAANKQSTAPAPSAVSSSGPPAASNDVDAKRAEAQRKIAEMKAKMAARQGAGSMASPVNGGAAAASPPQMSDKEKRIAEARARAEERARKIEADRKPKTFAPPPRQDGMGARGGMGVALHPSLRDDIGGSIPSRGKAAQGPKFSTTRGNQQPVVPKVNPYLADDDAQNKPEHFNDAIYDSTLAAKKGGERKSKQLVFNEKGKFMAQANALRQQARLEDMKKRIAAENRKVEIEEASDKAFLVPVPPDVEWWDEGLLPDNQNSYDDCVQDGRNKIVSPDSIITALIQHPVQLTAPQDRFIPAPKPLMLTKTEQAKMRRQRRTADMKEEQAKVRLGLVEPPPPKVKKSNMMVVLGEQAVKDPTAVEARVNREIAQRKADHDRSNEDRKLTNEQRAEKLERQQAGDEAKGIKICVFRVDNLSSGKHRYQVDVNAKQNALTGVVVLHPDMNLVIVEGGSHSITAYKKLMLNRIKWSENTLPLSNAPPTTFTSGPPPGASNSEGNTNKAAAWCNPLTDDGELKDLSDNRCVLVWEGDEQARIFKRWYSRACETDGEAREALRRSRMENMWTLARAM